MKKYIYILYVILIGVFASCSKGEMGGETPQSNQVTLKVATDEGLQTRAKDTGVDRYAIEVYTDAAYSTAANVLSNGTNKLDNATGVFAMTLDRTQEYYCLLWADKNGAGTYNITSLKEVTLTSTSKAVEAWHGTTTIAAGTQAALTATLKRAVSKITLKESGKLEAPSTLKLNFSQPTKFNVETKVASTPIARPEEVINISTNINGTTTPAILNSTDIFVLSSSGNSADLTDLTFKYNEEALLIVSQAPLRANFNTNISGHYTSAKPTNFTVTADGEWERPDNNVLFTKAKVGDFYMNDGTWLPGATALTTEQQAACIGIVYWTGDPTKDDATLKKEHPTCTNGLVVALKEDAASQWQPTTGAYGKTISSWITTSTSYASINSGNSAALTDPFNKIMGYNNTKAIQAFNTANSANKVEACEKVAAYQTTVPTPASNSGWFWPSEKELTLLCGLDNQNANVNDDMYGMGNKDAMNIQLAKITGSTPIASIPDNPYYWSSTESGSGFAWRVGFGNGRTAATVKGAAHIVRVVSAF